MDPIQRQLELLDKRLAGRGAFHRQIVTSSPLVFAAAGLIFGIVIQRYIRISYVPWLIVLLFSFSAAVLYFIFRICRVTNKLNPAVLAYLALVCAACLGGIRLIRYKSAAANDIRNLVGAEQIPATIRGVIVTKPYTRYKDNWAFARFSYSDPSSSFYLDLKQAESLKGWADVSGRVRVFVGEPVLDLRGGDYIEAYCLLNRFSGATNPGQFDLAEYLAGRNVYIGASVKSRDAIEIIESKRPVSLPAVKSYIRQVANNALLDEPSMTEREKGLLEALLLGYRGNIDGKTYRAFEKTGLLHFISLSGMHLGILLGIVWWLGARLGLLKQARAVLCIVVLFLFLLVVPARPPTLRTGFIFFIFCLSALFRRHPNPLNSLSMAAVILLLMRPTTLFEAGFQLSFASVLGILFFAGGINTFVQDKTIKPLEKKLTVKFSGRFLPGVCSYSLAVFSVGLAAWVGSAGILLYHFHTINPFAALWTVIVFPFVACILAFGFLKIVIAFLLPSVSALLAVGLTFLSQLLIDIVNFLSGLYFSHILIGSVSLEVVLFYYTVIAVIAWAWFLRPRLRAIVSITGILVFTATIGLSKYRRVNPDGLEMSCLDVGHGQAIVINCPDGTFLFDAGSMYNQNIGQRIVNRFLHYRGISKLDAVIISHDDIDHINGVIEIVRNYPVKNVYAPLPFIRKTRRFSTAKYLAGLLADEGITIEPLPEIINSNGRTRFNILWPDEEASEDNSLSDNDSSAVVLIEFAGRKILLCSDIEQYAQQKLMERFDDLRADIVVVPHHGSMRGGALDFLKSLGAKFLLCSCERRHYRKLQDAKPLTDAEWFYTAEDGALLFNIDSEGNIKPEIFNR